MHDTLVSTDWLADRLTAPNLRVVHVESKRVPHPHCIPGAIRFFWKDLCWHPTDRELVTPAELADRLGVRGISADMTLVLTSETVQYATYAYWALTLAGHQNLKVLDGSLTKWLQDNPLEETPAPLSATVGSADNADINPRIGRDEVRAALGQPGHLILDVRSPEEYAGQRVMPPPGFDHGAERSGRIPGAVSLYFRRLLNDDDTFRSLDELSELLRIVGVTPDGGDTIILYCRLSHRATLVWFAMTQMLGYRNVRVYDGSWTEWGSIVGFPIEV